MSEPMRRTRHPKAAPDTTRDRGDDWQDEALCRQIGDSELWFPVVAADSGPAKAICAQCPVTVACLEHALRTDERHGIYGGRTAEERTRMRNRGTA